MAIPGANPYKLHTFANRNIASEQSGITSGILGRSSSSPQGHIHRIGQNSALIGKAYDMEAYKIQTALSNRQSTADTLNAALPARDIATA